MAFTPIAGPSGSVLVGGVAFAFGKWRFAMKAGLPKVNNFTSAYQQLVAGLISGTLTLEGPYDAGNMPIAAGTSYAFTLKFSAAVTLTVTCYVEDITPSQDIEDAARVTVTAQSTGSFTAAIA
jgi:hypothetical protein